MADDDFEKLLRDVEASLGSSGQAASSEPRAVEPSRPPAAAGGGVVDRMRAGVPRAVGIGAGCGVVLGGAFSVLPFVDGISGALAGFAAGFVVSLGGRLRRRR